MAITPHDEIKIKDHLDRNFQARVLAAIERPKRSKFIAVINSGAFLWALTAITITFGGATFTSYRECAAEANKLALRYDAATSEITSRRRYALEAVRAAKTAGDVRAALSRTPRGREFKEYSIDELVEELMTIAAKSHSDAVVGNIRYDFARPFLVGSPLSEELSVFVGPAPIPLTDTSLENAKLAANTRASQDVGIPRRYFVHNCTLPTVLSNMLSPGSRPILRQVSRSDPNAR